ncbi:hypothetical protein DBR33_11675 [Stenotrophomonas sp. HMWF022]|nr:hypothetical protein DBR20_10620 [Stenotrophomonas sp. HMWF023]PTT42523.1 hypothetical protein DBR33_11675 [Stenotrophomonas sp. HMWF022]
MVEGPSTHGVDLLGLWWVRTLVLTALRWETPSTHGVDLPDAHDRWDGGPAPWLARLDRLMIEPKGRGAMC